MKVATHPAHSSVQPFTNAEAEQAVIGALLINSDALANVQDVVASTDFSDPLLSLAYQSAVELSETGVELDPLTFADWMKTRGDLESFGGLSFIIKLAQSTPGGSNARAYAKIVRSNALGRRTRKTLAELVSSEQRDPIKLLEEVQESIGELDIRGDGGPVMLESMAPDAIARLEHRVENPGPSGILTGFKDHDEKVGGLKPGQFIILAARPSQGKSALAMQIAANAARSGSVLFQSLEMASEELYDRLLSVYSGVALTPITRGLLKPDDWTKIKDATDRISKLKLAIDQSNGGTLADIAAAARRHQLRQGLDLMVIDYLQLMRGSGEQDRTQEIGAISRGLKKLAKQLQIPIIALSQLNRALENRQDKRPILSDLRQSGELEQDADGVWMLHRPEYYSKGYRQGIAELNIAKNRGGETGITGLDWAPTRVTFSNFTGDPRDIGPSNHNFGLPA